MDSDLYDEFGNYLGDDVSVSGSDVLYESDHYDDEKTSIHRALVDDDGGGSMGIVLYEDKKYYPDAEEVFPAGVETLVQDEDTQPLEQPTIDPIKQTKCMNVEARIPDTTFPLEFLTGLMDHPNLIRNIALIGHLSHGKTSFMDVLVEQTHRAKKNIKSRMKYTDALFEEHSRGISIKATPMSLVLPCLSGKSYLLNIFDCPGHIDFTDENAAAIRLTDGVVLVIDAAEGVMMHTEILLRLAVMEKLPICMVINKVDRLILDLKLPPEDAYHKLCHTIQEVNVFLSKFGHSTLFSPLSNNVCFASSQYGWVFSLQSFAKSYTKQAPFSFSAFAAKLWGNVFFDTKSRKFLSSPPIVGAPRTFVEFILNPLYKIYSHVLVEEPANLVPLLKRLNIFLKHNETLLDPKPLLKLVTSRFFAGSSGFVEMVVNTIPDAKVSTDLKVRNLYTGDLNTDIARSMKECDPRGPLVFYVTKLFPRADCSAFDAFGRMISGTLKRGDDVRVLGEALSLDDQEDASFSTVSRIWVSQSQYRIDINQVTAGNWALIEGVDATIIKTATICAANGCESLSIFRPLVHFTPPTIRLAMEPIKPSELPKMSDGLRKINKTYHNSIIVVEESGEHNIIGCGEMQLDCIMHDLREMYSHIDIKVADPSVRFCETVSETSSFKCLAYTPDKRNRLEMIAEPFPKGLAEDIESRQIVLESQDALTFFQQKYDWDFLESRNVWTFGPSDFDPNILCDHTIPSEDAHRNDAIGSIRDYMVQGFRWAAREGPLCDEQMRGVRFKLFDVSLADQNIHRGPGQIIPATRKVVYSSFMSASPKLMEPYFAVEIFAPSDCLSIIQQVVSRRRGHIISQVPKPGTPLFVFMVDLPIMDSFGFETDIRTHSLGQAFCQSVFDRWEIVPGDPLDSSIVLTPLEPQPIPHLAREYMIKTRRRKGLSEEVSITKYFDEEMMIEAMDINS